MNPSYLIAEWKRIRDSLLALFPELNDDEETLTDTIDGESGALDAIASLVRSAREDEANAKALGDMLSDMRERKQRLSNRADKRREAATQIMEAIGVKKVERADFTASLRKVGPPLVITDEGKLGDAWFKITRTPDRTAIKQLLEHGGELEGAMLGNPSLGMTVRFK